MAGLDWIGDERPPYQALSLAEYRDHIGKVIAMSRQLVVTQELISTFGRLTGDEQFIHMDPERAKDSPFGGAIAHGFLTLALFSAFAYDCLPGVNGSAASVNYGFDRVRLIRPVMAGEAIRARFTLVDLTPRGADGVLFSYLAEVGGDAGKKPAVSAEWLVLHLLRSEVDGEIGNG